MKKNKRIFLNIILLVLLGLNACKKKNFDDHIGPSICPTDKFAITEEPAVNSTSVNLKVDTLKLTASFNEEVPWTITIRGTVSKSFKKYSGYGKSISEKWIGNPDTMILFTNEACTVEFAVACKDPIVKNFTIATPNNFVNFGYLLYNGETGALGAGPYFYGTYVSPPNGANAQVSGLNSPEGGGALKTVGYSSTPQWFFGGYSFTPTNIATKVSSDPSRVYINCFVNVQGSIGTMPVITLTEGTFKRNINITVDKTSSGWQYFSYRLSDAFIVNPRNIAAVDFGLNSYPSRVTGGTMWIDFVSFTNDSPFISETSSK
ncbi:MAG TPA: hypothetical protein VNB90_05040 [Cytophagaceae bacterium]|jgi:hypothetical protein|nr:hypothetical protein [Cytophagaceae bacterium]